MGSARVANAPVRLQTGASVLREQYVDELDKIHAALAKNESGATSGDGKPEWVF